ncbi:MAG: GNAT family N-acetyltransferase [Pseudomonadota bacterium]
MPVAPVPPLRLARPDDSPALAQLINFAAQGLPLYLWKTPGEPGEDPWERGAKREAERASLGEITVIDKGHGVEASMTAYALREMRPVTDEVSPILRVLKELENEAIGTWYINVLAAFPHARGKGYGARLIGHAEAVAADEGLRGVSIIVADANHGARRLYERLGYRETSRKPMVKNGWENPSTDWLLLEKPIAR